MVRVHTILVAALVLLAATMAAGSPIWNKQVVANKAAEGNAIPAVARETFTRDLICRIACCEAVTFDQKEQCARHSCPGGPADCRF